MKVVRLLMQHIKGVRTLDIMANPTCNEISGANGAGKSSVLDAIIWAFGGKRTIDSKPLRHGAEKGEIVVETEALEVKRRFSENGDTKLTVTAKDGKRLGQKELDGLFGQFSFDPLAFSRMSPAEQLSTLQALAGEELCSSLSKLDDEIAGATEERTLAGRELGRVGQIPEVAAVEPVDVSALTREMEELERHNEAVREQCDRRERLGQQRRNLESDIRAAEAKLADDRMVLSRLDATISELPSPRAVQPTSPLLERIAHAGEVNRRAQEYQDYLRRIEVKTAAAQRHNAAEARLSKLREAREDLRRRARLPVDGVEFGEAGLRVNGIPFDQLSSSERIRISSRIGMSMSPELRVMFVRDGSLLDDRSFAELRNLAAERNYQLWVETVGAGHGDAIVLEQGEVISTPMTNVSSF